MRLGQKSLRLVGDPGGGARVRNGSATPSAPSASHTWIEDETQETRPVQFEREALIIAPSELSYRRTYKSCHGSSRTGCSIADPTLGSSALEFALVAPMLFLLYFAVFDFARIFYAQMTLQNAVRQAGRYAITGDHQPDPQHQGENLSRVNSIISVAQQAAGGLSVSGIQISSASGGSGSAGGPGDTVTISLTTQLQLMTPIVSQFFPGGTYTFTVSVSFKNEPFPPSNTS